MIGVITYDHPHRKTQDLLTHLKIRGYSDVLVIAIPWIDRKNFVPLFRVKPDPFPYMPERLCSRLAFDFIKVETIDYVDVHLRGEVILIAGAPILPANLVNSNTVINAHCGWIPAVRGLDSLKWAIYYDQAIGVTTHIVDEVADLGKKIERREVPLYPQDSLYELAMRQYEMEIQMLIDAVEKYKDAEDYGEPAFDPTRRMPHRLELVMVERFETKKMEINSDVFVPIDENWRER